MRIGATLKASVLAAGLVATGVVAGATPALAQDVRLIGSGASFPFPIYGAWFKAFSEQNDGITIDYQAKGSGAGIQDLINHTVDFAASDAAMSDEEISKVDGGVVLIPMTAGEIVLAYNLDGVDELKLPREVYPKIFTGEITSWSDPAIAEANPDADLPDEPITVVVRSDSSGTTYVFTKHLAAISETFANEVGNGKTVEWPQTDKFVAAPKNDGITAIVKQTPGAIGYIEYGYAKLTETPSAALENSSGNFVQAGANTGAAALASADFSGGDTRVWVDDPSTSEAYPIATFTWMLFYKDQDDAKAEALRKMVEYGLTEGQQLADQMGYIPLPEEVVEISLQEANKIQ